MENENKELDEQLEQEEQLDDEENTETSEDVNEEEAENTEEGECEDESDEEADGKENKGIFGKKKDKKEKKDKKTQQIEELTDQLKRTMAEFDNFRKRTDKEKSYMYENGARSVIEKLLPVVDNFERAFKDITDEQREDPFVDGMDKVFKQVMTLFEDIGVKVIETEGQNFNPDFHNAVMHIEDESLEENVIAEEFQKGYTYKDTVIRHSMVKVAN